MHYKVTERDKIESLLKKKKKFIKTKITHLMVEIIFKQLKAGDRHHKFWIDTIRSPNFCNCVEGWERYLCKRYMGCLI